MVKNLTEDPITKAILQYILNNDSTYLGQLSRELKKRGFTNWGEVYGKLQNLAYSGILEAAMVQIPGEPDYIKSWVKMYRIAERHKEWVKKELSQ